MAFLGKITPRKRVDHLIRAFARLRTPGATLVVAGNDMGAASTARAAAREAGVGDRTHFVGLLEGAGRLELLADADVVVYPSEHEIFGLVPLEALLVGTPVVVVERLGLRRSGAAVSAAAWSCPVPTRRWPPPSTRCWGSPRAGVNRPGRLRTRFVPGSAPTRWARSSKTLYGEVMRAH